MRSFLNNYIFLSYLSTMRILNVKLWIKKLIISLKSTEKTLDKVFHLPIKLPRNNKKKDFTIRIHLILNRKRAVINLNICMCMYKIYKGEEN